jgi:hypothetical protein
MKMQVSMFPGGELGMLSLFTFSLSSMQLLMQKIGSMKSCVVLSYGEKIGVELEKGDPC